MMVAFDSRRRLVVERLNAIPGIQCATPKGAFYAFPNISEIGIKAKQLASRLLDGKGVALVGGPDFGDFGEGYIRFSCAASEERIEEAIRRVAAFVDEEKPNT